jgi:integrase
MARNSKGDGSIFATETGWRGYITVDGKRKEFRAKTKAEANQKRRDLLNRRDNGTLTVGSSPTVEAWITHWFENIADLSPMTRVGYRNKIRAYIMPSLATIRLDKLTPEHLEQMYATMLDGTHKGVGARGVGASTIKQAHSIISRSLTVAVQRGHVHRNVALLIEKPSVPKPKTTTLSLTDTRKILAKVKDTPDEARWTVLLLLGLRPGEALGLTWQNVNLVAGEIHIRHQLQHINTVGLIHREFPKTDAGFRTITLPPFITELLKKQAALQAITKREEGDDWEGWNYEGKTVDLVFDQRNGKPISTRFHTTHWTRLLASTGIEYTRPYTARHTAATIMLDTIGDVAVVAHNLGHTDPAFTFKTYVHPLAEKKAELAAKLEAFASQ